MTDATPDEPRNSDDEHSPDAETRSEPASPGCWKAASGFLGHCLVIGSGFLLVTGLLLRLTIRDTVPYLCVFYYATPIVILALAALIVCGNRLIARQRRRAAGLLVMSILLFGWWHASAFESHPQLSTATEPSQQIKLLFWNISYVDAGWPAIIAELQKHDADVIGLVEVGPGYPHLLNEIRNAFPEHQLFWDSHGLLLARGEWEFREWGSLNKDGNYAVARAHFPGGRKLDTVLVDIHGFILMPRGPAMKALNEVLDRQSGAPVCVMGDFNTPPDSVFFRPLRNRLENAFEAAGDGYHVTWPTVAPVLALDQIWLPPESSVSCQFHTTRLSDHRLVTASALLPDSTPERLR